MEVNPYDGPRLQVGRSTRENRATPISIPRGSSICPCRSAFLPFCRNRFRCATSGIRFATARAGDRELHSIRIEEEPAPQIPFRLSIAGGRKLPHNDRATAMPYRAECRVNYIPHAFPLARIDIREHGIPCAILLHSTKALNYKRTCTRGVQHFRQCDHFLPCRADLQ